MTTARTPIIILHGWGLSKDKYSQLVSLLSKHRAVYAIDLPGFGKEPLTNNSMTLDNYVTFLLGFIEREQLKKVIIIGHSFGGRVGIKFAKKHSDFVEKLILTGAPVIRHKTFRMWIGFLLAMTVGKTLKALPKDVQSSLRKPLYFMVGQWDYYKAGPLRQVFTNIINEDIREYFRNLSIPVFLVWGEEDKLTPASDVLLLKQENERVDFVIIPGVGHKLPYEKPESFYNAIKGSI